jgi:hypothetical protein
MHSLSDCNSDEVLLGGTKWGGLSSRMSTRASSGAPVSSSSDGVITRAALMAPP